jgi:hypothetical protein
MSRQWEGLSVMAAKADDALQLAAITADRLRCRLTP